ncbi:MAG: ribosomal-protein-serine N-acetyltransferase [Segetibacter sp.]|nr:ribosomal-protein-serine N-acetyltransferase [Segetibacter sp.]
MNKIQIRPVAKEDFKQLYEVIEKNRERLTMYFPQTSKSIIDLETAEKFTKQKLKQALKKEQFYFVVQKVKTSEIIGSVILKNIEWSVPKGELAYFIDGDHEGKGITSYAVKWLVNYSFEKLGMEKLYIKFSPENVGSKKVAIKNGFEQEGFFKREFRTGHGELKDVERYGLLRGE